jgi:hypothetical protein
LAAVPVAMPQSRGQVAGLHNALAAQSSMFRPYVNPDTPAPSGVGVSGAAGSARVGVGSPPPLKYQQPDDAMNHRMIRESHDMMMRLATGPNGF